jgi:sugar-specific transcriptional regulator TrmB
MTKAIENSMKITIDKRIVRVFEQLPNTFTAKELATLADIPKDELKSVVYDTLGRMVSYGLVHKAKESAEWYKDHDYECRDDKKKKTKQLVELDGFELWLLDFYNRVKGEKDL